ncbi:hypothetical protein [Streptomyces sp. NWU339]|uniref:hypothetical protein n=1 Tax=Streptomyces sp. NWU339 TaxID=2185284 RepID=UPI0026CA06C7
MATADDVRRIALGLPGAIEKLAWGMPTFRLETGGQGTTHALAALNIVLTTADLARLNEQVDSWRRLPEDVARDYLESRKLLAPSGE